MQKSFTGLNAASRAWLTAQLQLSHPRIMVICKDRRSSENLVEDLRLFSGSPRILALPAWDTLPLEAASPQTHLCAERIHTLAACLDGEAHIVAAPVEALLQRVLQPEFISTLRLPLIRGHSYRRSELLHHLDACGYKRVSLVEETGDMAVRGLVIDLQPAAMSNPVRLEFVGDMLRTIRVFNAETQRSNAELQELEVLPVREVFPFTFNARFQKVLKAGIEKLKARAVELETPLREVTRAVEMLESGAAFPGIETLQPLVCGKLSTFFDYLPPDELLILDDEIASLQAADKFGELLSERERRLQTEHTLFPEIRQMYLDAGEFMQNLGRFKLWYTGAVEVLHAQGKREVISIRTASNTELSTRLKTRIGTGNAFEPLREHITRWREAGMAIAFVAGSETRARRLQRILLGIDIDAQIFPGNACEWAGSRAAFPVAIIQGNLSAGFQLPSEKLVFISESEIFAERSYRRTATGGSSIKRLMSSLAQLKENDYVVHVDYGVGLYRGLKPMMVDGALTDLLHIDYADSRLFLPVQNIGKIQKFSASEGKTPALDKLASRRWIRTKQRVKDSVSSLAGDLIRLYAMRSVVRGWRFEPLGAEDERFADGFPFNETPDQARAIEETIADMASERPMDRLVCGDVGFGKTEVALRAAFKSVQHARQTALLAPTTLLVEQHKETFQNRFMDYPVKIGAVSRFYSTRQNQETLRQLASGELDIVIGTHRLLSRDVRFKDLGLLIIDEEHRFGVRQKEKLKALKKQVDVLTLTATPIPRTLHMSLLGIRDISVISTPPHDRRTIRTYVTTYDDNLVRDAILRELQRGGQAFFVYNRVESIDMVTARLQQLVPEARFQFAHGQMSENELEKIMQRYMNREIDVLVCTTIIESGLDIPNANTIIIDRADTFGMAQLYQLRGRVGRSTRQAYSYFLLPRTRRLGEEAMKRLRALQSLDDLGLGFNLAVTDLEIRGAGNLLGREQSGNVLLVGFELYTRILKEAILTLKGDEPGLEEVIDPEVKLGVDAFIPESYIPDISERLVLYQRMAALDSSSATDDLAAEIADRFGPPPVEVFNLLELMRLRALFRHYGVLKADISEFRATLAFSPRAPINPEVIIRLVQEKPEKFKFSRSLALSIDLHEEPLADFETAYAFMKILLERIAAQAS